MGLVLGTAEMDESTVLEVGELMAEQIPVSVSFKADGSLWALLCYC